MPCATYHHSYLWYCMSTKKFCHHKHKVKTKKSRKVHHGNLVGCFYCSHCLLIWNEQDRQLWRCILVFHHVVKCLQVKDLYTYSLCINSVLILYSQSVYDCSNKEKLLFVTLNVIIYALSHVLLNLFVHCRFLEDIPIIFGQ